MSPKLVLAILFAASAGLAKGQNNAPDSIRESYHLFFPAMGKDILSAHIGTHSYKIINVYDKPSEVYVDDRKLADDELSKYAEIIQRIKSSVTDDDEDREMREMERDRRQAQRDAQQAGRDREQEQRDREQHQRDRIQERIDHEQEQRDHAQKQLNREEERRNRVQEQRERVQEQRDQEQTRSSREETRRESYQISYNAQQDEADKDQNEQEQREQFATDRSMLKKGIQVLVDEHIISVPQNLKTLVLTDTDVSVNGIKQSPNIYQEVRTKLGDWARNGFSYDSTGPADNYSLSIND